MHRCSEYGLSFDREGFTFDPDERAEILYRLARFTNNDAEQIAFLIALQTAFDPWAHEKHRIWRHVYLGRYLRIPPSEIERMPVMLINRYISTLSELIKKEAGPSRAAETDYI